MPWIRLPSIKPIPSRSLSERQDKFIYEKLLRASSGKSLFKLEVYPNAWMKIFKVKTEKDIDDVNRRIKERLRKLEEDARRKRQALGKGLIGKEQLKRQTILKAHTPKKRERRIFVVAASKEKRLAYIKMHDEVCRECAECYKRWKMGDFTVQWPPGTFPPSPTVRAAALVWD